MNGQFDIGNISPVRYFTFIAVIFGLLFAFIAPESESTTSLLIPVIYWQLQTLVPMAFLVLAHLQLHRIRRFNRLNPWLQLALSGVLGALLFSPLGFMLDSWRSQQDALTTVGISTGGDNGTAIDTGSIALAWLEEFIGLGPPILVAWLAINAPWIMGFRISSADRSSVERTSGRVLKESNGDYLADEKSIDNSHNRKSRDNKNYKNQTDNNQKNTFFYLLPKELGNPILYLEAELHYLKVATAIDDALVLYNLKDAIDELQEIDGFQSHRSYWVNKAEVHRLVKRGRQGELVLSNGARIPVSRSRLKEAMAIWSA